MAGVRGMRRKPGKRAADFLVIERMYLQSRTLKDIAEAVGVTERTVVKELQIIKQRWHENTAYNLDEIKSQELARLDALEAEYWEAWRRSQEDRQRTTEESTSGESGTMSRDVLVIEGRIGNPAFLAGVERCIDMRCKLLGIYAAVKQQVEQSVTIDVEGLSDAELRAIVES